MPEGVMNLVIGSNEEIGETLIADRRFPLISATGSTRMGRYVAERVASRLGKTILELGGNNAIIVTPSADLEIAIPGIVFGSVGTCGQRCTTTRRLIIHESIYDQVKTQLVRAYQQLDSRIGNPLSEGILIGPMIDAGQVVSRSRMVCQDFMSDRFWLKRRITGKSSRKKPSVHCSI